MGEAINDNGNGSFVIEPHENATIQNKMQYLCMVSRVGVTKKVNFTVIGTGLTFKSLCLD